MREKSIDKEDQGNQAQDLVSEPSGMLHQFGKAHKGSNKEQPGRP
jgi:hypothetical protein